MGFWRKMLENDQYIFSQFATHNALTASTIIEISKNKDFEFQKLYVMGRALHNELIKKHNVRIYAPIGKLEKLLAYLMERMLENGANACFVNQVNNAIIPLEHLIYNQYEHTINLKTTKSHFLLPKNIYLNRENAMGYDLGYKEDFDHINQEVSKFYNKMHKIGSLIDGKENINPKYAKEHYYPARFAEKFADITAATKNEIKGQYLDCKIV